LVTAVIKPSLNTSGRPTYPAAQGKHQITQQRTNIKALFIKALIIKG
jgi:hypothetical protein